MADVDKNRVIVLAVVEGGLSVSGAAHRFAVTRQWIHRLLVRYRQQGLDGLQPRSTKPRTSPSATPDSMREQILAMRAQLDHDGWDAGAESIRDRLTAAEQAPPSVPRPWVRFRA